MFFLSPLLFSEPLTTIWSHNIRAEGGSTNGKEILLRNGEEILKLDKKGKIVWKRKIPHLKKAFLLPDGQVVALTGEGNNQKLSFLNLQGYSFYQFFPGRVVSIAFRNKTVAVTTGRGELYIFSLRNSPSRLRGWRKYSFHKQINDIAILTDGKVALAMPQELCIFKEKSQPLFYQFGNIKRIFPLPDGGFISLLQEGDYFYISRHNSSGYITWSKDFKGEAQALLSFYPFYCLSLVRKTGEEIEERKLVVLESNGDVRWQRGGLLFKPIPLFLTSRGELLCTDEEGEKLLLFNGKGRFIWERKCPGNIRSSIPFDSSSVLILYLDKIEFLEVKSTG